ncbi:MAG: cupin domain-containing protein [Polyangiaceae bacterium]
MKSLSADQVIGALGLSPHPEGGFFRETFRAQAVVAAPFAELPRAASTAIYFLLRVGDFSAFHSVRSDEVWHHYLGATLELHTIDAAGEYERIELGPNLLNGEVPQWVVPANRLQGARIIGDGFGLFGCTVAPGFDFADFNMPPRAELVARFPALADLIESFTR